MLYSCILGSYFVSFIHFVCIVGSQFRSWLRLESHSWRRVGGRLIRADSHKSSDSLVEMSDELASTLASIKEFMVGVSRRLDQIESSCQDPHPVGMVIDETVPHAFQTTWSSMTYGQLACSPSFACQTLSLIVGLVVPRSI